LEFLYARLEGIELWTRVLQLEPVNSELQTADLVFEIHSWAGIQNASHAP